MENVTLEEGMAIAIAQSLAVFELLEEVLMATHGGDPAWLLRFADAAAAAAPRQPPAELGPDVQALVASLRDQARTQFLASLVRRARVALDAPLQ